MRSKNVWLKRFLFLSVVLNLVFFVAAGAMISKKGGFAYITSKFSKSNESESFYPLYHIKESIFNNLPKEMNQYVFLGDSITAHYEWREMLKNNSIVNRGIPGDTTEGVLNRLSQITQVNPSKIFLLIGINDLQSGKSVNYIAANYKKIIDTIRRDSPETKIIMTSVLPVSNKKYKKNYPLIDPGKINSNVVLLNQEIQELTEENKVYYLDLFTDFIDGNGEMNTSFTYDGLHISGNGYAVWKDKITQYIMN